MSDGLSPSKNRGLRASISDRSVASTSNLAPKCSVLRRQESGPHPNGCSQVDPTGVCRYYRAASRPTCARFWRAPSGRKYRGPASRRTRATSPCVRHVPQRALRWPVHCGRIGSKPLTVDPEQVLAARLKCDLDSALTPSPLAAVEIGKLLGRKRRDKRAVGEGSRRSGFSVEGRA